MRGRHQRSISVNGDTYRRLQAFCAARGLPIASFVQEAVDADLDARGVPPVKLSDVEPRRGRVTRHETSGIGGYREF